MPMWYTWIHVHFDIPCARQVEPSPATVRDDGVHQQRNTIHYLTHSIWQSTNHATSDCWTGSPCYHSPGRKTSNAGILCLSGSVLMAGPSLTDCHTWSFWPLIDGVISSSSLSPRTRRTGPNTAERAQFVIHLEMKAMTEGWKYTLTVLASIVARTLMAARTGYWPKRGELTRGFYDSYRNE